MDCLCASLWYNHDNVLISRIRVVLKGHSYEILKYIMLLIYKKISLLWSILSYDDL